MTITAKYPGKCKACGAALPEGAEIQWVKGSGSTCPACPAPDAVPTVPAQERERDTVTVTDPGVYETGDGEVYVVKPNREKTRLYAKRLVEINPERATETGERVQIEFEYARGAIYGLSPDMKMDLDRAKALTIRYGRCIVCGRNLKAAESVERGIGPVCIKSFRPSPSDEALAAQGVRRTPTVSEWQADQERVDALAADVDPVDEITEEARLERVDAETGIPGYDARIPAREIRLGSGGPEAGLAEYRSRTIDRDAERARIARVEANREQAARRAWS
jgi:hypothetical protein